MDRATTYYVTTYWQTDGIKRLRMIPAANPDYLILETGGFYLRRDSKHLHKTLDAAKEAASKLAWKQLDSLERQMERMRELVLEPKVEGE